jgi:hypothetical protein
MAGISRLQSVSLFCHYILMGRYYFHLLRGNELLLLDDVGVEVASDDAAIEECRSALQELFKAREVSSEQLEADSFKIVDGLGRVVAVLTIRDVVSPNKRLHSVIVPSGLCGFVSSLSILLKDILDVFPYG